MSADGSCQHALSEVNADCLLVGMKPGGMNTSGHCQARQRLPQRMVGMLARQSGALLGEWSPQNVSVARPTGEAGGRYHGVDAGYGGESGPFPRHG